MLMELPMEAKFSMLIDLPSREPERQLIVEPKCAHCNTETADPSRR
jgi:hypothetical protein